MFRSAPQKSGYPWFRYRFIASLRSATASPPLLSLPRFLYYIKNIDFYQKHKDFMQLKARNFLCFFSRFYSVNLYLSSKFYKPNLCFSSMFHSQNLCLSSRKLTFIDFYEETAASAIRIVLYSIPSCETASRSLSVPLTVIFWSGSTPETIALSNSSPCAQHARTSVIMQ